MTECDKQRFAQFLRRPSTTLLLDEMLADNQRVEERVALEAQLTLTDGIRLTDEQRADLWNRR